MCSAHTLSSLPAPHNPLLITVDIMTLGTAEAALTDQAAFFQGEFTLCAPMETAWWGAKVFTLKVPVISVASAGLRPRNSGSTRSVDENGLCVSRTHAYI